MQQSFFMTGGSLRLPLKTMIGKNFAGTDVLTLAQGAGYQYLREAFEKLYNPFRELAGKTLILVGHLKATSAPGQGENIQVRDINLTGKQKSMVCMDADAIGFLHRKGGTNTNILSFKASEQDIVTGARQEYLTGKDFEISVKEDGVLKTNWSQVFPSLKTK